MPGPPVTVPPVADLPGAPAADSGAEPATGPPGLSAGLSGGRLAGGSAGRKAAAGEPGQQSRRRHNRWKVAFFLLAAIGIVAAVAWALLGSRFLVVRSIEVTGTHLVPKSEVLAAAQIPKGLPLARVNTAAVARRVERITQVESARVTRQWPDRILITVQERTPALAIRAGSGFDLVDAFGVVVRHVAKQPRGMPLFTPTGPVLGNPGVRAAVAVLGELPAPIARRVRSVTAATADSVILHLAGRITVNWGGSGQPAQKGRELTILLRTHARYYDLSAPGTAVTG
jgi:cell division protein FtsQ